MKICIIIGTRPEVIRLSRVIHVCRKYFETTLIHTGQNYDYTLNEIFFNDLEMEKPDYFLNICKGSVGDVVGEVISKTYNLFQEIKPDLIIILGDTNSCLSAYSAKRLKIPIFHLEAGNRAFDPNLPEEVNRRMIDHISDVNICYMEHSRHNLLRENLKPQFTFVVGSPIPEIFEFLKDKIDSSNILNDLQLEPNEYFIWSVHREDNVDNDVNFSSMIDCIENMSREYQKKIVFGAHPRTMKKIQEKNIQFSENVLLVKPFGIIDYYKLMKHCSCIISDSGTLTEETNLFQCRGILYRCSTEHPEGVDNGHIILGNLTWDNVKNSLKVILNHPVQKTKCPSYINTDFSNRVLNIITAYPSIINRFNWLKL